MSRYAPDPGLHAIAATFLSDVTRSKVDETYRSDLREYFGTVLAKAEQHGIALHGCTEQMLAQRFDESVANVFGSYCNEARKLQYKSQGRAVWGYMLAPALIMDLVWMTKLPDLSGPQMIGMAGLQLLAGFGLAFAVRVYDAWKERRLADQLVNRVAWRLESFTLDTLDSARRSADRSVEAGQNP